MCSAIRFLVRVALHNHNSLPDSYDDLDAYLNDLDAATWFAVLRCNRIGGIAFTIRYLRSIDSILVLWTNNELIEYFSGRDLEEDYTPTDERL